jgi:hypothetical protein
MEPADLTAAQKLVLEFRNHVDQGKGEGTVILGVCTAIMLGITTWVSLWRGGPMFYITALFSGLGLILTLWRIWQELRWIRILEKLNEKQIRVFGVLNDIRREDPADKRS